MFRNKNYVFGDQNIEVPAHGCFGRQMVVNLLNYTDRKAVINAVSGEYITFGEFAQVAVDVAVSLTRIGVKKGDVVGMCSEKRIEYMPTVLGIICAGASYAATDVTSGPAEIKHRINLVKPNIMICSEKAYKTHENTFKNLPSLRTFIVFGDCPGTVPFNKFLVKSPFPVEEFLPVATDFKDIPIILFSSGTTGLPKAVPISNLSTLLNVNNVVDKSAYAGKSLLVTREWYYTYGFKHTLGSLFCGTTVVFTDDIIQNYFEAIHTYKTELIQLASATANDLVKSPLISKYDISCVEYIISSSTPFDKELINAVKKSFPNLTTVSQVYGMTEMGCICMEHFGKNGSKLGSVGGVAAGYVLKVLDLETKKPLGANEKGEIYIKSFAGVPKYIGDAPENYADDEGFFRTGDIGYYDEDRCFYIIDRIKDIIKFNTYQVCPAQLEAVLIQHPCVKDAGVIGAPHPQYGEVPTALVVLLDGADINAEELVAYVGSQVSYRMRLEGGVRFVSKLPRNAGKLDRKSLKTMLN